MSVDFLPSIIEAKAQKILPNSIFEYISGYCDNGITHQKNQSDFHRIELEPRILTDTSKFSRKINLFDHEWSAPFGVAPMGGIGLAAFEADLVIARSAKKENIPFILSGSSIFSIEKVSKENENIWFQLYPAEKEEDLDILERLKGCGINNLVITVDVPVPGNRENDKKNGYAIPLKINPSKLLEFSTEFHWIYKTLLKHLIRHGQPFLENYSNERIPVFSKKYTRSHSRAYTTWDWLNKVRDKWQGKIILKGVLSKHDHEKALQSGIDACMISNHGGRQLETGTSTISSLSSMGFHSVNHQIMIDSGIRRGLDIIKCLSKGASMAFIGRPFIYAAAIGGESTVIDYIKFLKKDIDNNMRLLGANSFYDLHKFIK